MTMVIRKKMSVLTAGWLGVSDSSVSVSDEPALPGVHGADESSCDEEGSEEVGSEEETCDEHG